MNDYRYYASETTLRSVENSIDELNTNITNISNAFYTLIFAFAILLAVIGIEKFLDTMFYTRK